MDPPGPEQAGPGPSSEAAAAEAGKQQAAQAAKFAPKRNRGNIRKRPDAPGPSEGEATAQEEGGGEQGVMRQSKVPRAGEPLAFTSKRDGAEEVHVTYESSRAIQSGKDNKVTAYLETETDTSRDARALREAKLRQGTEEGKPVNDGKYKGMNNYIDYRAGFRSEHSVASEKGRGAHGPLRASMYVRSTSIMDYNPSLCKDYKETGFCSYGDSCKFMHDRGDYKMSWELDRVRSWTSIRF
ncbi:hypothetical protein DUNSADRAFT_9390 [Dunaliella salina]|uniref:C3H1-type domain-containing protein n=1 Tax=Dunaliella salina TaxID=3046 RepID=A0ABQ7GHK3_DUNSA|nr:hypothetical protein DUNSADRAFT_9390 [Dunaliella salina]|eukprot:KAF5834076.1 hypothetical protein DUNSADRAFT_9390 [Dunaliella salina]